MIFAKLDAVNLFNEIKQTADNIKNYQQMIDDIDARTDLDKSAKDSLVAFAQQSRKAQYIIAAHSIRAKAKHYLEYIRKYEAQRMCDLANNPNFATAEHQTRIANVLDLLKTLGENITPSVFTRAIAPIVSRGDVLALENIKAVARQTAPSLFNEDNTCILNLGNGLDNPVLNMAGDIAALIEQSVSLDCVPNLSGVLSALENSINKTFGENTVKA